jgi:hypothetical protein
MALGAAPSLQLTASYNTQTERRKRPRSHEESRVRARLFEFFSVGIIAVLLASAVFALIEQAFARPLLAIRAALGG